MASKSVAKRSVPWRRTASRILKRSALTGEPGHRPLLVVHRPDLDVILFDIPLRENTQPREHQLFGFIQRGIEMLGAARADDLVALLHLPNRTVESLLIRLKQMGAVDVEPSGEWRVPKTAVRFSSHGNSVSSSRQTRKLVCYWPEVDRLLPVLPRVRQSDFVRFEAHKDQQIIRDSYENIRRWPIAEAYRRGRPATWELFDAPSRFVLLDQTNASQSKGDVEESRQLFLAWSCRLEVIGIVALRYSHEGLLPGLWEVDMRMWSEPVGSIPGSFLPGPFGESVPTGLSLLRDLLPQSLSESVISSLEHLLNDKSQSEISWQWLISNPEDIKPDFETKSGPLFRATSGNSNVRGTNLHSVAHCDDLQLIVAPSDTA